MYERKTPEDLDCGLVITMKILSGKWKPCIIDSINKGFKRPSDIHKILSEASPRVLNMQLSELQFHGIVYKVSFDQIPLRVEYNLTRLGKSLLPVIAALDRWGINHKGDISFDGNREELSELSEQSSMQ